VSETVELAPADCDSEPIHIPGSIQPYGMLVVADRNSLSVTHVAGDVEGRLGVIDWLGRSVGDLITDPLAQKVARLADSTAVSAHIGQFETLRGELLDVSAHPTPDGVLIEIEPASDSVAAPSAILGALEAAGAGFERAAGLKSLCDRAAAEFRQLTGFDRVMVYQFLDDEAGVVLAEDRDPGLPSFLNHHFPGSDIPRQARALYLRNLVRVIPDAGYRPAPLRPARPADNPLDMSECVLRSVSPVHLEYLRNMGVAASASVSIVKDGVLWGLIACHNATPRRLSFDQRVSCRVLAGGLARQIKAKEEAETYRERLRLRGFEDDLLGALAPDQPVEMALADRMAELQKIVGADGVAMLRQGGIHSHGVCPGDGDLQNLAAWLRPRAANQPFAVEALGRQFPKARPYAALAAGVLAVSVSPDEGFMIIWFRAETAQVIDWAGNPHKAALPGPAGRLTPRASFEAWRQSVIGEARPWTTAEIEAAGRLKAWLMESRTSRRLRDLNLHLTETLSDRENLLQQKDYLLREVNHRVQNSLQLVTSFLAMQARASEHADLRGHLEEAQRRISAVALVHRRLYRADQVEAVDLARYVEELWGEMRQSMGEDWATHVALDLAPLLVSADRAVILGLILTELVINANKYAYGGAPGPIEISLEQHRTELRLIVADRGQGRRRPGQGFGSRMMAAMISQLAGRIDYSDNRPGLRAIVTAPIAAIG
jgi:light-regulated signal transduction histidine kinase (bacteriophytochrome)